MRPSDAQDIVRQIEQIWMFDFGEESRGTWRTLIQTYEDAGLVSEAIFALAKTREYKPTQAEIRSMVAKLTADKKAADIKPGINWNPGKMPGWVREWFYARFVKSPPDLRPFREQYPEMEKPPEGEWMPANEYVDQAKGIDPTQVTAAVQGGAAVSL